MRRLVAIALFVGCAGLVTAQEKYASKEGKFTAAFPGKATTTTQKANDTEVTIAVAQKAGTAYLVTYSDLDADTVKNAKPRDLLIKGETGLVTQFKAKLVDSKDVEVGKHPARQVMAEKDQAQIRVLIVLVGNRVYQVMAIGPKEQVTGKDADAFFRSFAITK